MVNHFDFALGWLELLPEPPPELDWEELYWGDKVGIRRSAFSAFANSQQALQDLG